MKHTLKKNKITTRQPPKQGLPPTPVKVKIRQLRTGVRGLDAIMGGGLPEFSFNIIAGTPGCGKTTLAHQVMFANATPQKPSIYFTVLGEPALKMLRYQQQYTFFNPAKLGKVVRFINLNQVVLDKDLDGVLREIIQEVQKSNPSIVVVDSFRNVAHTSLATASGADVQSFV